MRVDQYQADERMKSWLKHYERCNFKWDVKMFTAPDGECIVRAKYHGETLCGFVMIELSEYRLIIDGDMGYAVAHLTQKATFDNIRTYDAYYLANKIDVTDRNTRCGHDSVMYDCVGAWLAAFSKLPPDEVVAPVKQPDEIAREDSSAEHSDEI